MLQFVNTSLLEADTQTVVNTVNTVGVMGKGLAKHFAEKYPEMFSQYKKYCESHLLETGKLWLWKGPTQWVLNFPTKKHWRNPSKLEYIEAGLQKFVEKYEEKGITEISFPRLGCGNGGLDWRVVRPLMEKYLAKLPIVIYVHDFQADIGAPEHSSGFMPKPFVRSYESFLEDLRTIITANASRFKTISDQLEFRAQIDIDDNLVLDCYPDQKNTLIPKEDLYEAWQMLVHGPITETRLVGKARDESLFVLSILATLPYARALELRQDGPETKKIGVELIESLAQVEQLTSDQ